MPKMMLLHTCVIITLRNRCSGERERVREGERERQRMKERASQREKELKMYVKEDVAQMSIDPCFESLMVTTMYRIDSMSSVLCIRVQSKKGSLTKDT